MKLCRWAALAASLVVCLSATAQKPRIVAEKNFYLCSRMGADAKVSSVLTEDPVLSGITQAKFEAFKNASSDSEAFRLALFSDEETARIGGRLSELAARPELAGLYSKVKESGRYYIFNDLPAPEFLKAAWEQDAAGINRVIGVYGFGEKALYPKIDSIDFQLNGGAFKGICRMIRLTLLESAGEGPFFRFPLETALAFVDVNDRYEAADFEPMEEGINKKAYAAVRRTRWNKYPYTAIVVLGAGSRTKDEVMNPTGKARTAYAANLYRQGLAPFIIVSGGRVHPFKTPYSEAEQMKKYLMEVHGIPEEAIIAEPHARHTTTNVRDAARIMVETGFPLDKPALMTSNAAHLDNVQSPAFERLCLKNMLVFPMRLGTRLGPQKLEFWALPSATQISPLDPLAP